MAKLIKKKTVIDCENFSKVNLQFKIFGEKGIFFFNENGSDRHSNAKTT